MPAPRVYRLVYKFVPRLAYRSLARAISRLSSEVRVGLDVGAGVGLAAELIAHRFDRLYLLDVEEDMLREALRRLSHLKNVVILRGDARSIPLRDESVDLVYFFDSLHHIEGWEKALAEALRVLRPGGVLAIFDMVGSSPVSRLLSWVERRAGLYSELPGVEGLIEFIEEHCDEVAARTDILGRLDLIAIKSSERRIGVQPSS